MTRALRFWGNWPVDPIVILLLRGIKTGGGGDCSNTRPFYGGSCFIEVACTSPHDIAPDRHNVVAYAFQGVAWGVKSENVWNKNPKSTLLSDYTKVDNNKGVKWWEVLLLGLEKLIWEKQKQCPKKTGKRFKKYWPQWIVQSQPTDSTRTLGEWWRRRQSNTAVRVRFVLHSHVNLGGVLRENLGGIKREHFNLKSS